MMLLSLLWEMFKGNLIMKHPEIFSTLESKSIHENPYWDYHLDRYIMPNGDEANYYFVKSRGSVVIVPKLDIDTFILVRQYRYLNKRESIEFPGGGCNSGLSIIENAKLELAQEAGYKAEKLTLLSEYNPCNGMTDEICNTFLAEGLSPYKIKADDSEAIDIVTLSSQDIIKAINNKSIWDGMTLAAWSLYNFIER